jgi:ABC-type phosphate transport system substrate-binding protein
MRTMKTRIVGALLGSALFLLSTIAAAEVAIITHPGTQEIGLSKDKVADVYLGKIKSFSDGTPTKPVDQSKGSLLRAKFYKAILGKTETEMNRYWSKRKYTGKGKPPVVVIGDEAVKELVANTPGAIGYIDGKSLDKSVKVILIIR